MEEHKSPFLQTKALMDWFRGVMIKDIHPSHFRTFMKIPWLNHLEKTWMLPKEYESYMMEKTLEYMEMFRNYKKFELYPWQWKGDVYQEDINAMDILEKLAHDQGKLNEKVDDNTRAMQKHISDNLIQGKKKYGW
jgi:hypothetical protein